MFLCLALVTCTSTAGVQGGCAGKAAREHVASPVVSSVGDDVIADAIGGIATLPESGRAHARAVVSEFAEAIYSKDRTTIVANAQPLWPKIRDLADRYIAAGLQDSTITSALANSKRERLKQYEMILFKIQ